MNKFITNLRPNFESKQGNLYLYFFRQPLLGQLRREKNDFLSWRLKNGFGLCLHRDNLKRESPTYVKIKQEVF